jgi:hypothetical protein
MRSMQDEEKMRIGNFARIFLATTAFVGIAFMMWSSIR